MKLLTMLEPENAAEVMEEIPELQAVEIIEDLTEKDAAAILDEMESDEQAFMAFNKYSVEYCGCQRYTLSSGCFELGDCPGISHWCGSMAAEEQHLPGPGGGRGAYNQHPCSCFNKWNGSALA
jgi:hypothetical protein